MYEKEPGLSTKKESMQNSTAPKLSTIHAHSKDEPNSSFASLHDSLSPSSYKTTIPFVWMSEHDVIDVFDCVDVRA
jgi:hypothetical protein